MVFHESVVSVTFRFVLSDEALEAFLNVSFPSHFFVQITAFVKFLFHHFVSYFSS